MCTSLYELAEEPQIGETLKQNKMTNLILSQVNQLSKTESYSSVKSIRKSNGAKMLILANKDFNIWVSFATGKFYADDNNGNWYSFK